MTIKYYIDSLLSVNLKCGYVRKGIEYYISRQLRSITTVFMISQKDTDAHRLRDFVRYSYIMSQSNDLRENFVNGLTSVSNRHQKDQLKEIGKQLDRVSIWVYPLFNSNKNPMKEAMREIERRNTASERGEDYKGEC